MLKFKGLKYMLLPLRKESCHFRNGFELASQGKNSQSTETPNISHMPQQMFSILQLFKTYAFYLPLNDMST